MSPLPHDDAPVKKGDVLAGKYRVEQVLGVGGMGVVVAATQIELQRLVALKFVLPTKMNEGEAVERFLREARAAVRLKSEHVARVLDVGRLENGAPYMVMEFLEGSDLDQVLRAGSMPAETACEYIVQACEALAEAHSIGLVHRDLKPHNLFLTKGVGGAPLVKVLDFGISKTLDREQQLSKDLTRTTSVLGSPFYMSPEQMRSARKVDARSDIWSLGVILYELLTTHVPWEAESITELALKVTQEPPTPIEHYRLSVPEGVRRVIEKCLQKDASQRYENAGQLAMDLAPFASARAQQIAERAQKAASLRPPSTTPTDMEVIPPTLPAGGFTPPSRVGASTHATWGDSAPPKREGARSWMWGGVALIVAAGVGVAFVSTRGAGTTATPTPPTEAATKTASATMVPNATTTSTSTSTTTTTTANPSDVSVSSTNNGKGSEPTVKKVPAKFVGKTVPPGSISVNAPTPSGTASAKSSPDDDIPTLR